MARGGLNQLPPVIPPPGIRRYLRFTKLSTAAVQAVARVLDRDDDYRSQVAAELDEDSVDRAAWLWLTRPEGWRDEFDELAAEAAANAATASDEREERDARKRLSAARAAAERATAVATAREQEAAEMRADLVTEQAQRRRLERQVTELEAELAQAREERAAAVRQLKDVEATLARRVAEAKEATARLRELEHRPEAATADELSPTPVLDAAELAEALDRATVQATELAATLRELTQLVLPAREPGTTTARASPLGPSAEPPTSSVRQGGVAGVAGVGGGASGASGAGGANRGNAATGADEPDATGTISRTRSSDPGPIAAAPAPRRTARPLPGGIRDDSPEAVELLLRSPGAWLLIDGYNVSMVGWPEWPVAEQRRRLVAALGELAARTGAAVKVIFDGAIVQPTPIPQSGRRLVSVLFSPAGVEADDMLLDFVRQLPPAQPVVVASSDNRVREGARRLGANLIHARQLLDALRR